MRYPFAIGLDSSAQSDSLQNSDRFVTPMQFYAIESSFDSVLSGRGVQLDILVDFRNVEGSRRW